jgi:hypothetical protein
MTAVASDVDREQINGISKGGALQGLGTVFSRINSHSISKLLLNCRATENRINNRYSDGMAINLL